VFSIGWKLYPSDQPELWPPLADFNNADRAHLAFVTMPSRRKVHLEDVARTVAILERGGRDALRRFFYTAPVSFGPAEYLQARLAAARRALAVSYHLTLLKLQESGEVGKSRSGNYRDLADRYPFPKSGGRAPLWQWQFVHDYRLATGAIGPDQASFGGRPLESSYHEPWAVFGDWELRTVEVEDWLKLPLK
jgi:hypothetical protein